MIDFNADLEVEEDLSLVGRQMNFVQAQAALQVYMDEINKLNEEIVSLVVTDDMTLSRAASIGTLTNSLLKKIGRKRDEIVSEPKEFIKQVGNLTKVLETSLEHVKLMAGQKVMQYRKAVEDQRRRAEEARMKESQKVIQEKLNVEAKTAGIVASIVPEVFVPEEKKIIRTEHGSQYSRKTVLFEVKEPFEENIVKVPANLLMLNEKNVRAHIKMGVREIPGLRIWDDETPVFRS